MTGWLKRTLYITIAVSLLFLGAAVSGCGEESTPVQEPTTRIVMDKDGNAIAIPYNVERVAPQIGAMAHMTALLGCADRIVAAADQNLGDYFKKIFPEYTVSNPKGLSTSNAEEVIASGAQVLYGPITDEATIAQYKAAGIAVVPLNTFSTVDEMKDNIRKIAEILGGDTPAKAEEFCQYYQQQIDYVTEKTKDISDVKILSLSFRAGAMNTINSKDICSVYMTAAGGENVAGGLEVVSSVGTENVIQWNPDIIITMDASSKSQILAEPAFQTIPAVKDGKVFIIPYGTYLWSVRSSEGAMMPLWLAKIMHPDVFADLDMNKVIRDYYKKFYDYDVPADEIEMILAGRQT